MKNKLRVQVLNKDLSYVAVLENAFKVTFTRESNTLWTSSFRLPINDPKRKHLDAFKWIELSRGNQIDGYEQLGLYRIMPMKTVHNRATDEVTYNLEHVLSTLLDNSIFRHSQLDNRTTTDVLTWLLGKQKTKHWKLGKVEFKRYFSYSWENENLLSCLFSIPKTFDEQYRWEWDTTKYPFTLNLVKPNMNVVAHVREGHNLIGFEIEENPDNLFNRIYPLGAGEGVNQLGIEKVNKGIPYLENKDSIAKYGLHEIVWADRRFTVAESLKASAQSMLDENKKPKVTWDTNVIDVSELTGVSFDKFVEGSVVVVDTKHHGKVEIRIIKEERKDAMDNWHDVTLKIGSPTANTATTNADLARRQQINELYSQGQTTILQDSIRDNCDASHPAVFEFDIDQDVVNVNTVELTFSTKRFRANSRATKGGGARVGTTESGGSTSITSQGGGSTKQTSSSGGSSTQTSTSGGGTTTSSSSAGQSSQTSSSGGDHNHKMFSYYASLAKPGTIGDVWEAGSSSQMVGMMSYSGARTDLYTASSSGTHSHTVTTPAHTHSVTIKAHSHEISIPSHTHSVSIPSHTHQVNIPSHKHQIILPDHTHEIDYGIYEESTTASKVTVKANGSVVGEITGNSANRVNIVKYLAKAEDGTIIRGRHKIELIPNGRARIEAKVICRVFIQSQLGGEF